MATQKGTYVSAAHCARYSTSNPSSIDGLIGVECILMVRSRGKLMNTIVRTHIHRPYIDGEY